MGRPRKTNPTAPDLMEGALKTAEDTKLPIDDMPLETMRDYRLYNAEARRLNKQLKICRYTIRPCPVELHPTERVVFSRNDQPTNPLPVYISDEMIHFEKTLIPGQQYDLPKYVVHHLAERGKTVWGWKTTSDGSSETRIVGKEPRFSLKTVYTNYE